MARIVMQLNEHELTAKIMAAREAERAGDHSKSTLEALGLDIYAISAFAAKYFRMGQIQRALHSMVWLSQGSDSPVDLVSRMVGYCQAARMFLKDGVPIDDHADRPAWSVWAHLRLGRGGAPLAPTDELRRSIGDKLEELEGWTRWAQAYLSVKLEDGTLWDGTQDSLRWEMCRLIDDLQARANPDTCAKCSRKLDTYCLNCCGALGAPGPVGLPAPPANDWDKWAQRALGLTDAYVEDQKITTDDLRRMISERL